MSAADLLRQAIEDAPDGLHVDVDGYGDRDLFDADDVTVMEVWQRRQAALRLIGLLLAAAPHLADLLDAIAANVPMDHDTYRQMHAVKRAFEEAAR